MAPRRGQGCESYENVRLWLANNEKVGYTDLSHMLQYVHGSGSRGLAVSSGVLFWQIGHNREREYRAFPFTPVPLPSGMGPADGCLTHTPPPPATAWPPRGHRGAHPLPARPQLGPPDTSTLSPRPGPFTSRSPRARAHRVTVRGGREPRVSLSPLRCPRDTPLVPGPGAGDKGIFASEEGIGGWGRGLQKQRREAYKTCLSPNYVLSAQLGGGA